MIKRTTRATLTIGVLALSVFSLAAQQAISFVNTIAVGDSLTAGFQSGVLKEEGQIHSYASLIARQVGTYLFLPLLPDPGFGAEITLVSPGPIPVLEFGELTLGLPQEQGGPRTFLSIVPQNLAIPGHTALDALTARPDLAFDSLEDVILGLPILVIPLGIPPLSQVEMAVALQPTFTILWLGANEVLDGVFPAADASLVTPLEVFQETYTAAVGAILTMTPSRLIVANVPDVTVVPFLTPAEQVAALAGAPLELIGPLLGIGSGDFVTAFGVQFAGSILAGEAAGPLPPDMVATAEEVASIRQLTDQMNAFIEGLGLQFGFPVVDINSRLLEFKQNGVQVGDATLTTNFLGGIFSLDGIHPTNTGQGILANEFIAVMNDFFALRIPPVDLEKIMATDPLVLGQGSAHSPPMVMSATPAAYQGMASIFGPGKSRTAGIDPGQDPLRPNETRSLAGVERYLSQLPRFSLQPGPVSLPVNGKELDKSDAARKYGRQ
ncbi:MAG: SGNH/GDSL hydrolase family protein [Acidobacteriota bacterium]